MTTSVVVSVLALLVSASNFYLTVLRRKTALIGWIAGIIHEEDEERPITDWTRDYAFALSNTGTVDLLVREASVHLTGTAANSVPDVPSVDLPAVIKPGEVTLVHLSLPNLFVEKVEATLSAAASIEFQIYSARGKFFMPRKLVVSGKGLTSGVWKPFKLGKRIG